MHLDAKTDFTEALQLAMAEKVSVDVYLRGGHTFKGRGSHVQGACFQCFGAQSRHRPDCGEGLLRGANQAGGYRGAVGADPKSLTSQLRQSLPLGQRPVRV